MQQDDYTSYSINDVVLLKQKMLSWVNRFNIFCFLDNNNYNIPPNNYDCLVAAGSVSSISSNDAQLKDLEDFFKDDWSFGHLSYNLKNKIFHFHSPKEDVIGFPDFYFFKPQVLLLLNGKELKIYSSDADKIFKEIQKENIIIDDASSPINFEQKFTREEYINTINFLQHHIHKGDCYEINFCQEFFALSKKINAAAIFNKLNLISPNPFSAFYKLEDKYLICASPERFLTKTGKKIFSQPIKGTAQRNLKDVSADEILKQQLFTSQKERSENVMVVDLVRNDLSKICKEGSVHVEELFGIYSFPQVHQMISTISGEMSEEINFSKIIEATFPMGSMTGAPKHRVLQLIEEYEKSSRGIFSGSVGYVSPGGNFDFNVVIRSIMYNSSNQYLSYQVGSGVTFYSNAEREWEECLWKAAAIKKVLAG